MTIKLVALVLMWLMIGTAVAQEPKVTPLMSKDLAESPGREALMITVEHAPGGSSAIHRHNAHAFVYVLEGSVVMQLKGGQEVTLTPGQTFYEGPDDVHLVDRNASSTAPAKFVVFCSNASTALCCPLIGAQIGFVGAAWHARARRRPMTKGST